MSHRLSYISGSSSIILHLLHLFLFVIVISATTTSVSEAFINKSTEIPITTDSTVPGSTEPISTTIEDSETTTMTIVTDSNRTHIEEPKLPVDLLSEVILLDPNVVLARLSRDVDSSKSWITRDNFYRTPVRRTRDGHYYSNFVTNKRQSYASHKFPIYPVFPGE